MGVPNFGVHQNRASPFASDFYRRRGYRREFRSEDHFYLFSSQKKSRFASGFFRRGNRASWSLKPCPSFPWCFCFLGLFLAAKFLGLSECFVPIFQSF